MSVALQFNLTSAGKTAVFNAKKTGLSLDMTHIQMGSGNRVPNGQEVALVQPQEAAAIAGGSQITPNQVRMAALFSSNLGYEIREIGLWSGNPANPGSVLFGYWSQAAGVLAVKAPGVDFVFSHDMVFDGAVPAGSVTVVADAAQAPLLAMIAAHEAKLDPHPMYVTKAQVQAQSWTAFTTAGAAGVLTLTADPGVTKLNPGLRLRVKFHANSTGNDSLNVDGLGAKSLKQYAGDGTKVSTRFFAGQLSDVEWDGVDFVVLDSLPSELPAGGIGLFAMANPPVGWLRANGAVVSRSVYAALFAAIGTTYGAGDGASTFGLPDLRGEFIRGLDNGRGVDVGRTLGSFQGDAIGTPAPATNYQQPRSFLVTTNRTGQYPASDAVNGLQNLTANGAFSLELDLLTQLSISRTSLSTAKETRPRNVALLACIKY